MSYILVFFGVIMEGEVTLFTSAFLTRQGFLNIGYASITLLLGALAGDLMWYALGTRFGSSTSFIMRWLNRVAGRFDNHITKSPIRTIFISKFTYGFHRAVLVRAGILGLPIKRIFRADFLVTVVWMIVVGGLGYALSASIPLVRKSVHLVESMFLIFFIGFIILEFIITKISEKKL
ncbi:MAG TPA: VTT domain-containing protein [Candidatus Paceibacterota bacterium]